MLPAVRPWIPAHALCVTALACALLTPGAAHAQEAPTAAEVDEARFLFGAASAKLQVGRAADAIPMLERSLSLVPSPNTELLLGRALRDVGRRVEGLAHLDHAAAEANRRAAAGESKYAQTASAARAEGESLRAQLGVLTIHLEEAEGASLLVDGLPLALAKSGDTSIVHEPGRIEVVVRSPAGEQRQVVSVVPGQSVRMEFGGAARRAAEPPAPKAVVVAPPPPEPSGTWMRPAAWISTGIAVAGAGTFTFFGLRSQSTYDDLDARCGPFCGAAERPEADRAIREQTVGLGRLRVPWEQR